MFTLLLMNVEHLLKPQTVAPSKDINQIKNTVEEMKGSIDGIKQNKQQIEERLLQLEEMFKRTLEVVSLQRAGT